MKRNAYIHEIAARGLTSFAIAATLDAETDANRANWGGLEPSTIRHILRDPLVNQVAAR
jgi:hypothetical protein